MKTRKESLVGGQHGLQFTLHNNGVAVARPIICALATYGVNATPGHVRTAALDLYSTDFTDLFMDFQESGRQHEDETPMSHNDFVVACVDATFNTDITVKGWWADIKRDRRKLGDLMFKTILNVLRAKGGNYAPSGVHAQLGVNDKNLSSNLRKAINMPGGHNPLVKNLNVTNHSQDPKQVASQMNSLHSGKFSDQNTDEGMQVPDANLLQGDFICAVFKNSIQQTIVGTLKTWDQGESDCQTLYVTTLPYYLQIHTHMCLALQTVSRQIAYLWHVVGEDIPQDAFKKCDFEEPLRSSDR